MSPNPPSLCIHPPPPSVPDTNICPLPQHPKCSPAQSSLHVQYMYSATPYKGHDTTRDTLLVLFRYFLMLNDPSTKDTSIKRTSLLVPMVSVIEGSIVTVLHVQYHMYTCTSYKCMTCTCTYMYLLSCHPCTNHL